MSSTMRFFPLLSGLILITACKPEPPSGNGAYKTVATVGMIADVVNQIAGDKSEVEGLIGEGVDPHLYKPTSSDVKKLQ
ncbi:MAG: zinc ABC transporter substrate-binding protein, partial [Verrucomicrobiota bacterium]